MFQILENKEIIASARSGNNEAVTKIITELMPCVESAAHRYSSSSVPVPDLVQEGLIGAVNSVFSYDEAKGIKFSTYAQVCINNSIISAVRKSARKKHMPLNGFVPLEDVDFSADSEDNPESIISMNERIDAIYNCIDTRLTELERNAILLYIAEGDIAPIAQKLGITPKAVSNALSRARKKIRSSI